MHSSVHADDLLDSQEFVRAFQGPQPTSQSQFFLLNFLLSSLLVPVATTASNSCNVKNFPLIIFNKYPSNKAVCTEKVLKALRIQLYRQFADRSYSDNSLEMKLFGALQAHSVPSLLVASLLVFMAIIVARLLVSKAT